ncbi:MAG: pyridoxal phosphate-dependent aminotransferase [Brevinematales bacterium]|nr:pyridoxal phosphate-dependent aminotransferase [Brevinematales bacterium]
MSFSLSKRAIEIEPSATLSINAKAKELKSKGYDIINLTAGESDLPVPEWIIKNIERYLRSNGTNTYKPTAGIQELRKEIAEKYEKYNNVDYSAKNIVISIGAKQSIYLALSAICNEGDEVIIISPYWVSYIEQIKLVGAKPVILKTKIEDGFIPDIKKLSSLVTSKTKAIIINSPNNPTGVLYPRDILEKIVEIAKEKHFYIISDEIYENYIYEGEFISIASISSEAKEITLTINGFSKSHSITGWRLGYVCASEELANIMDSIQSHISSGTSSIVQYALLGFLDHYEEDIKKIKEEFTCRRNYIKDELSSIKKIKVIPPQGAFYYFIDVSNHYNGNIKNSVSFCSELLDKKLLSVVPGNAFGDENCIRLSFASNMETIKEGIKRLKEFINNE